MNKAVYFICAADEFIADIRAKEIFEELSAEVSDDMSKEIILASANSASEAERICLNAMESARTVSLFGGKKVVWMRGLNFINDGAGRSKDTQAILEKLADFTEKLDPAETALIISAAPVDKRKAAFKKLKDNSNFESFEASSATEACFELLRAEAKKLKISAEPGALEVLVSTVAANPRMALSELRKLAAYLNFEGTISQRDVVEMVPIFGEGDFFELTNLFYSGRLKDALAALRRHFFTNKNASARPIITALQKQNAILLQIRALMDGGKLPRRTPFPRGTFEALTERELPEFKTSAKNAYNVFSQNPWYVGNKLAPIAERFPLKKFIDIQMAIAKAFEDLIHRPGSDELIMRELFSKA